MNILPFQSYKFWLTFRPEERNIIYNLEESTFLHKTNHFIYFTLWFQVGLLVADFFSYPVVQTTKIEHMQFDDELAYPKVTFCNQNPLRSNYPEPLRINGTLVSELFGKFDRSLKAVLTCNGTCSFKKRLHAQLEGFTGFIQQTGVEEAREAGHQKNTFFVSCYITFQKGLSSLLEKCDHRIEITTVYHPRFQNCFSVDVPVFDSSTDIALTDGLSLIIFLDFLPNDVERPFYLFGTENTIGALAEISKKKAMPFARSQYVLLAPGKYISHLQAYNFV